MTDVKGGHQSRNAHWGELALCVLLSLLLHAGAACLLTCLPQETPVKRPRPKATLSRHVQVLRPEEKKEVAADEPPEPPAEEAKPKPIVKTSADAPQHRPEKADFESSHDAVASGEADAPQRSSDAPLPTIAGRETEDELVVFDQDRQDGDLAHEGKKEATPQPPSPSPSPSSSLADDAPSARNQPASQGMPDGAKEDGVPDGEGAEPERIAHATRSVKPATESPRGDLLLTDLNLDDFPQAPEPPTTEPIPLGLDDGEENVAPSREKPKNRAGSRPSRPVYDPSLAADAQPGFRTYERRTRSTGRFVFGSRPSLNVESSPRGLYEAEIYRRIARIWYAACDEHRGDIIPGSITVSLRLNRRGGIASMDLMRRRGASVIQQSFSFGAIRQAALPPMPEAVRQEVIGELYEMILTFNFD